MLRKRKDTPDTHLVAPLLHNLASRGVRLTEKAVQSLVLAAKDAVAHSYSSIYDDSLLTGLVKSQSSVTHLLDCLGIDLAALLRQIHEPYSVVDEREHDGRKRYIRHRRSRRQFETLGYTPDDPYAVKSGADTELPQELLTTHDEVGTETLFLTILNMPVVWHHMRQHGLSVNKVRLHAKLLGDLEPDVEAQKYILSLEDDTFRFRPFDFLDAANIAYHEEHPGKGIIVCRANVITPAAVLLQRQIEEFEGMINLRDVSEYDIQRFLQNHPGFLLGLEHKALHSQLMLSRDGAPDLRPDFLLERIDGSLCDVADLKLPSARLVVGSRNRRTFSAAVTAALGQLREYRNYFDDVAHRRAFHKKYGLEAYKPKMYVVIGRSAEFQNSFERSALQEEFSHLDMITYDDLVAKARRRLDLLRS